MFHKRSFGWAFCILLVAFATFPSVTLAAASPVVPATPRDLVIARGLGWVDHVRSVNPTSDAHTFGVVYSQSRYASELGAVLPTSTPSVSSAGYRTDCSGFVSMCWNLRSSSGKPFSASTGLFASSKTLATPIAKAQLRPGDMLLRSTAWAPSYGHAVLFVGWTDATKTSYWAMEQTSSKDTVLRINPYPYFGTAATKYYRPYRSTSVDATTCAADTTLPALAHIDAAYARSRAMFPKKVKMPALVVTGVGAYPDAFGGAALAKIAGGPLLLTNRTSLSSVACDEILRLRPARVYVLGNATTVTTAVDRAISSLGIPVTRISGANRLAVSGNVAVLTAKLSKAAGRKGGTVFLASGLTHHAEFTATRAATGAVQPLLLTSAGVLSTTTVNALKAIGLKRVRILGPTSSVSSKVESALKAKGYTVIRVTTVTAPSVLSSAPKLSPAASAAAAARARKSAAAKAPAAKK